VTEPPVGARVPDARAAVERARLLIETGRHEAALRELGTRLAQAPGDGTALCLTAQALLGLGRPEQALQAATEAAKARPHDEWPLRLTSIALERLGRYDQAVNAADAARAIAPTQWRAHVQRADVDVARKKITKDTWAAAQTAVKLAPGESDTHFTLGNVALAKRKRRMAERAYREALRCDPEHAAAQNNLAVVHLRRHRLGHAIAEFVQAARLDPTSARALANLRVAMLVWARYLTFPFWLMVVLAGGITTTSKSRQGLAASQRQGLLLWLLLAIWLLIVVGYGWWVRRSAGQPIFGLVWRMTRRNYQVLLLGAALVAGTVSLAGAAAAGTSHRAVWITVMAACGLASFYMPALLNLLDVAQRRRARRARTH